MSEDKYIIVFCTAPNEPTGKTIATELVGSKLAACVNILPGLTSVYSWKDNIETDSEALLMIKTVLSRYAEIEKKIRELHPYEIPEIIAIDVVSGSNDYLSWITESVARKSV